MINDAFTTFEQNLKKPEVTMTPLIDMVFLLLIFFVVTTTFTKETGITVDKVKTTTAAIIPNRLMVVSIDSSGGYWFDKKRRALEEITGMVVEKMSIDNETNLVLVPDKNGRVEPLVMLLDRLRAHQITRFSLGTQQDHATGKD